MTDRQQLEQAIAALEAQRSILGDAVVDAAIGPMRRELAALAQHEPEQQRKLVTLLFCDVAGSTAMVRDLDPEDSLALMDTAMQRFSAQVEACGGRVLHYMGDGFLALFGHPVARENDAEMATRAGLAILQEAQAYAAEVEARHGVKGFTVRVGVNTGRAVIGGQSEGEDTVAGAAVNLAARMERAAAPGTVLISHETYQHVRGVFDLAPQEPITPKGFDRPVPVYRVLAAKPRAFRSRRRGVEGIETRMVGRQRELEILQEAFRLAVEEGERQMVTLVGEPGLGKSRLLYEFENWADLQPVRVQLFQGRARQEARTVPYDLLRSLLAFRCDIQDGAAVATVREKLTAAFVAALGPRETSERNAHILGQLLGYDFAASPHVAPILGDAQQIRGRGLMYLAAYFEAAASQAPVVMLLEDLHWADDSSLDGVTQLVAALAGKPVVVVGAARPELYARRPHWFEGQPWHQRLDLRPLLKRESQQLVDDVLQKVAEVPEVLRELIVSGAEGNPFYVEELIKMLIDEDVIVKGEEHWHVRSDRLPAVRAPATLTEVLQARLDSLPEAERVVLQQASVVGRVFWDAVLNYLNRADADASSIPQRLAALRAREMIFHREVSAFSDADEYIFKHALLQDVTYETVLKRLRRTYHELTGEWLAQASAEQGRESEYAGLVADHFALAGRRDQARVWLRRAADSAAARYANAEAIAGYERLLPLLDEAHEQVDVLLRLGDVLHLVGRWDEVEARYREALTLAEQAAVAAAPRCQRALGYLALYYRWDLDAALAWLELAREGWQELEDQNGLGLALAYLGTVLYWRGDYAEAEVCLAESLRVARATGDTQGEMRALNTSGLVAHALGRPERAREWYHEGLALAQAAGDQRQIARTLCNLGLLVLNQDDPGTAERHFDESRRLFQEIGDRHSVGLMTDNLGLVALWRGDAAAARERFRESLAEMHEVGDKVVMIDSLAGLAGVASLCGDAQRAARLAAAAETQAVAAGVPFEPVERRLLDRAVAAAHTGLGAEAFAAAWAEGQAMALEEAKGYALEEGASWTARSDLP